MPGGPSPQGPPGLGSRVRLMSVSPQHDTRPTYTGVALCGTRGSARLRAPQPSAPPPAPQLTLSPLQFTSKQHVYTNLSLCASV